MKERKKNVRKNRMKESEFSIYLCYFLLIFQNFSLAEFFFVNLFKFDCYMSVGDKIFVCYIRVAVISEAVIKGEINIAKA